MYPLSHNVLFALYDKNVNNHIEGQLQLHYKTRECFIAKWAATLMHQRDKKN